MSNGRPPIDEARARELLQRERDRIEASLADRERLRRGEVEEVGGDDDPVDDGEVIGDEEVDDALITQFRAELAAVERAEKRLEDGTYGLSIESGEPISADRLETIPWAERTPDEQERFERTHGRAI
jgi:DnaK suppressor protein